MFKKIFLNDEIILSPYTTKDEKNILLNILTNSNITINDIFESLRKNIQTTRNMFYNLEKRYLLIELRNISIGEEYDLRVKCTNPECLAYFDATVDLSNILKPGHLKTYNGIKLKNICSDNYQDFVDFNIDDLDIDIYDDLIDYIDKNKTKVELEREISCPLCSTKQTQKITDDIILNSLSEDSIETLFKSISQLVFYGKYTKKDIEECYPFERNIYIGLLEQELKDANKNTNNNLPF